MTAHLYLPNQEPQLVSAQGFTLPNATRFAQVPPQAAQFLGCAPGLVDVLVSGEDYVVYSVFDSEEAVNTKATIAVAELTNIMFEIEAEDEVLRGPILIIK